MLIYIHITTRKKGKKMSAAERNWKQKANEVTSVFPWYKDLFSCTPKNLEDFPLMTAELLEQHYYTQPLTSPDSTPLHVYQTSGTSSKVRKQIYYSEADDQVYINLKTDVFHQFIKDAGVRTAMADMGTGHAASTALKIFDQLHLHSQEISFQLPIAEHVKQLKDFQPDLFYTMPSILDHLVYAAENPAEFGIKKIILVGEIATKPWIKRMAQLFCIQPTDIMDTYGSIEIGTIAYYSHEHDRYLLVDGMLAEGIGVEAINLDIDPLREDEQILVLTSFARKMFPAIRFVTYDVVRDLKPIQIQGEWRQSFKKLVKRVGTELKHGEKISLYDIEEIVYRYLPKAGIRVKVSGNALRVLIQSPFLEEAVKHQIQHESNIKYLRSEK
ncbi:CoF synthetase [Ammoniphilus sp. CFH 90114]|uniref:CoF synthetase n=1 Tax=Ammoniphilus sp. CFH 90114 TaxID=2493665 RepID=UPI00100ED304|nr:CoF synthetase [Ammoniphilus sp. CFH 90114]RXT06968.1 CoF synthetase [Ammoniphilus sp. CFH 90114]